MTRTALCLTIVLALAGAALAQKMTYDEAKKLIPSRPIPSFWVGDVKTMADQLEKVKRGEVREIASSPGGRPISVVTYGELEEVPHKANFNSAIGGRKPTAYVDKAARQKPVVYIIGPVHGHEVEGLTGVMSLISVMETGKDLRGKPQPELRKLGDQCRLLIVPCGNPDGLARFEPRSCHGMKKDPLCFWAMGTWADDSIAYWPTSKQQHPRHGPEIGLVGCYFDDAGINPMHDEFLAPMGVEAPAILRIARDEGPDLAVSLHSSQYPPAVIRPAYTPLDVQAECVDVADRYYALLDRHNLPHQDNFRPKAEQGKPPESFNLTSALYHISGATPFTFECPHGIDDEKACHVRFEQILDIQLLLYEAMLAHELELKSQAGGG